MFSPQLHLCNIFSFNNVIFRKIWIDLLKIIDIRWNILILNNTESTIIADLIRIICFFGATDFAVNIFTHSCFKIKIMTNSALNDIIECYSNPKIKDSGGNILFSCPPSSDLIPKKHTVKLMGRIQYFHWGQV